MVCAGPGASRSTGSRRGWGDAVYILISLCACVENNIAGKAEPAGGDTATEPDSADTDTDSAGDSPHDSGAGTLPEPVGEIDVAPTALDFGVVDLALESELAFTVQNVGDGPLTVETPTWGGGDATAFTLVVPGSVNFPAVLDPAAYFDVAVIFAPNVTATATGNVVVESDDADEALVVVDLTGSAVSPIGDFFVVITDDDRQVSLFYADGAGSFAAREVVGTDPGEALDSPVVGDADGDGSWDILTRGADSDIVYINGWDGAAWIQGEAGSATFPVQAAGDFDGDGALDLVGLDSSGDGRSLAGAGDGSFAPAVLAFDAGPSWSGYSWRLAPHALDVDGDGNGDLVAADYSSAADDTSRLWLLTGNGDGTFAAPDEVGSVPTPVNGLDVGDFDGDSTLDVAAGLDDDGDAGQLFLLLGDGAGDFGPASLSTDLNPGTESGTNGDGAGRLAVFDWTADGLPDVLCTYQTDPYAWDQVLRLVPGNGTGLGAYVDIAEPGTIDNIDLAVPTPL